MDIRTRFHRALAGLLLLLPLPAVSSMDAQTAVPAAPERIEHVIRRLLEDGRAFAAQPLLRPAELARFYAAREYQPAWSDHLGLLPRAYRLRALFRAAADEAIDTSGLHLREIERLQWPSTPAAQARLDLHLSDAFFAWALKLGRGQIDPRSVDVKWFIELPSPDVVGLLEQAIAAADLGVAVEALTPHSAAYRALRRQFVRYRELAAQGGWPLIPARGPKLVPGAVHADIPVLKRRLRLTGDLGPGDDEPWFDETLAEAVRRFQRRHGLQDDGVVGRRTRQALSRPVEQRLRQIALNLERWRWLPRDLGRRYILVNMAGFELQVREDDEVRLSMRVIVGKPFRATPTFRENMTYLVFNPYWNVPGKLARRDLVPALLRDPAYFERKRIRVLSGWDADAVELDADAIDWRQYAGGRYLPYRLRQDPGPDNSLGRIKFMLPNPFSVYLHDTPSRHLFQRPVRTFSSGCIRVEKPVALASYVLGEGWDGRAVLEAIDAGRNRVQRLKAPIPVYILYQTAWVDEAGHMQFRDDVYQRDRRLAGLLPTALVRPPLSPGDDGLTPGDPSISLLGR